MKRTILIRTDVLKVFQIELWPLVVHRDAVPKKKKVSLATVVVKRGPLDSNHIACSLSRNNLA